MAASQQATDIELSIGSVNKAAKARFFLFRLKLVEWVSTSQQQQKLSSMTLIGTLKMTFKLQPEPIESVRKIK